MRTARCHLRGQAPSEPETCPAPKSLASRGKIKQARDVREFSLGYSSALNSSVCNYLSMCVYMYIYI